MPSINHRNCPDIALSVLTCISNYIAYSAGLININTKGATTVSRTLKIVLRIFFLAYIIALYGFIVPAHGHEDFLEHHHCVLCQLSGIAAIIVTVFILVIASGGMVNVSIPTFRLFSFTFESSYPTRAPPPF